TWQSSTWNGALACGRCRVDRRGNRQWFGERRRLVIGRSAPTAVRLSLSLCLRDDYRAVRIAGLVRAALTKNESYAVRLAYFKCSHLAAGGRWPHHARAR